MLQLRSGPSSESSRLSAAAYRQGIDLGAEYRSATEQSGCAGIRGASALRSGTGVAKHAKSLGSTAIEDRAIAGKLPSLPPSA